MTSDLRRLLLSKGSFISSCNEIEGEQLGKINGHEMSVIPLEQGNHFKINELRSL